MEGQNARRAMFEHKETLILSIMVGMVGTIPGVRGNARR